MVQYLYDNNIIIYTFAALGGIGFLLRVIVNLVYKHLVKESDRLGETKNKMLKHMKMKFSTCYKLKIGVNNVDTFVDKNVLRYKFCGILLSTWDNTCGVILFLSLLIVPIISVFGVIYKCGQDQVLLAGAVGILTSAVLIIVDKFFNITGKRKMLRLNLLDYLENFCKVRLEQEATHPELVEQYRREYFQAVEGKQSTTAATLEQEKEEPKEELNRRREARLKKEEEKKLMAAKREEEQKKAEEARREEAIRKQEERKQVAARRREEERQKIEEEKEALEARRAELKKKAEEKQRINDLRKQHKVEEKEQILHSIEEELKSSENKTDMDTLMNGLEEIAAEKEQALLERATKDREKEEKSQAELKTKAQAKTVKAGANGQEDKLIEDVLKEFFA